jgi:hypothetical protein
MELDGKNNEELMVIERELIEKIRASKDRYPREYEDYYEFAYKIEPGFASYVLLEIFLIAEEEANSGVSKEDILKEINKSFTGRYGREIFARIEMTFTFGDEDRENERQRAFDVMREIMKAAQALEKGETLENILVPLAHRYAPYGQEEEFGKVAHEMATGEWGKKLSPEETMADGSKWEIT